MVDVKTEKGDETSTLVSKDASSHAVVVHSSVASYDVVTWLLLSVAIVVILVPGWLVATDPTLSTEEKRSTILILAASLVFSIVVFLLVLPKEFQVLSDASINVVTC
jgi:hypothetical protein